MFDVFLPFKLAWRLFPHFSKPPLGIPVHDSCMSSCSGVTLRPRAHEALSEPLARHLRASEALKAHRVRHLQGRQGPQALRGDVPRAGDCSGEPGARGGLAAGQGLRPAVEALPAAPRRMAWLRADETLEPQRWSYFESRGPLR